MFMSKHPFKVFDFFANVWNGEYIDENIYFSSIGD